VTAPAIAQTDVWLTLETLAGKDVLIPTAFDGEEALSEPFRFRIEAVSDDGEVDLAKLAGKGVTLEMALPDGGERRIHGIVARLRQDGRDRRSYRYTLELRPWLWLLSRSADCRIFQNQTVTEIIEKVFSTHGQSDFDNRCTKSYNKRDYCVQYNETAMTFVSRLMEEEGIFYFFEHQSDKHTLVLADDTDAYVAYPGGQNVTYRPEQERAWEQPHVIDDCSLHREVVVEGYEIGDYYFETPSTDLTGKVGDNGSKRRAYRYPGGTTTRTDSEKRARLAIEAHEVEVSRLSGAGVCRGFAAGTRFTLEGHFRSSANRRWAIRRVGHRATHDSYVNTFEALPDDVPFRQPQRTPRPRIAGSQTAVVVGPDGKEIWTDKYGRVKVQFHWDREGGKDDKSSCWIRVAQGWAGKGWGAFFLPRIGMEVVVGFLEGDPDRPLVTGCVYNAQQTVPYQLPGNATRSTVKSRSTEKGDGFNELRFEDKKGEEEVFLHAEKDLDIKVKNDRTLTVDNDDTITVEQQRKATIKQGNEILIVQKGSRTVAVKQGDETHSVKGKRNIDVTGNEIHGNKANFTHTVKGNYILKVTGNLSIDVKGKIAVKSAQSIDQQAGQSISTKAGQSISTQAGMSIKNQAGQSIQSQAGQSIDNKAGMSLQNAASMSITNKAGMSVTNRAGMAVSNMGGLAVSNKGGLKMSNLGTMNSCTASGIMSVTGALVKIG
jgi:type VI secretion system secreted protein VgrG